MTFLTTTEVLFLLIMSGSMASTDLAALVQPGHYFNAKHVEPTIDRLIDFAIAEPKTPALQIRQLTALRQLANDAVKFKKAPNYDTNRLAIEEIAAGQRANDRQGFARDYAHRLLAKLDGTKTPAAKIPAMRDEALAWFPSSIRLAWALDLRQTHGLIDNPDSDLAKLIPDDVKIQLNQHLEKVGNVRIERVAYGVTDSKKADQQRLYLRLTGKGNPDWLADLLSATAPPGMQTKRTKADDGTPVLQMQANRGPVVMLIGDTDIVIASYQQFNGNLDDLVSEVLDVRAKKKANAAAGLLKDRLAKIPDKVIAFAVTDLSEEFRKSLSYLIDPCPGKISAYAERTPAGLDIKAETTTADAVEANKFVKKVDELRKEAIKDIQEALKQPEIGGPPAPYRAIINLMESVQVQANQDRVDVRGLVPRGLLPQLGRTSMYYDPPRGFNAPQPVPFGKE